MKMETGLFEGMVLQRDAAGRCNAALGGRCESAGALEARVTRDGRAVRGFARARIGSASKGRFSGRLAGLPAGGPYDVTLRIASRGRGGDETLEVRDVLVGDVWVIAGQSNMGGGSVDAPEPADTQVRAMYADDLWGVARTPILFPRDRVAAEHRDLSAGRIKSIGACGPGVYFGWRMRERTGAPQGLIHCAVGGTSMNQWNPALKNKRGSLYANMIRRFAKAGGRVAGLLWYQGESDVADHVAGHYAEKTRRFIQAVRKDFDDAELPIVAVQIGRVTPERPSGWNLVQDAQRRLAHNVERLAVVPVIDLELCDFIHLSGPAHQILGPRLAAAMWTLTGGPGADPPPPDIESVELPVGSGRAIVRFRNVVGELSAPGRALPRGFDLRDADGAKISLYQTRLDGDTAILHSNAGWFQLEGANLHYGYGCDPHCNVSDAAARPLPVFGPIPVSQPRAVTPWQQAWSVSKFFPSAGRLDGLDCPAVESLDRQWRNFPAPFCKLNHEWSFHAPDDVLVYYAARVEVPERCELGVWLGYDGPVKLWIDDGELYHDPDGAVPSTIVDGSIRWDAAPGDHKLIVALASDHGRAYGMCLRLERLDAKPADVAAGKVLLPQINPL